MRVIIAAVLIVFLSGCSAKEDILGEVSNMKILSVFGNNGMIPSEYTCDGSNIAPKIEINDVPKNAKSIAIIVDDPDAPGGSFVHWVLWNIPADSAEIGENSGVKGRNDFGRLGYGGPCPPSGSHRYFFRAYSLDSILSLREGSTRKELEKAMKGHIIAEGVLMGKYSRK